jgi:hypothetical protein
VIHIQLVGQALGLTAAGFLSDLTGEYTLAFLGFAGVVTAGSLLVLTAISPQRV